MCRFTQKYVVTKEKLTQYVFGAELTEVSELEVDVNDGSTSRNG